MKTIEVKKAKTLCGRIIIPPDKSISHRAVMLGALSKGKTCIKNFLLSQDCLRTLRAFRSMGIEYSLGSSQVEIKGKGLFSLKCPEEEVYVGNSGTTMRLLLGILSAQKFKTILKGDASLNKRPMKRVIEPLRQMGAKIKSKNDNFPPLSVAGTPLKGISYKQKIASAQVKSAILLAGLYAQGTTSVCEKIKTRDHTERMFNIFGIDLQRKGLTVWVKTTKQFTSPGVINIPSDFSSAAFFIAAATLVPGAQLTIKDVGVNPTRIGFLKALLAMGAKVTKKNQKNISGEPRADLVVKYSPSLKSINIKEKDIPAMIDELPIFLVVASQAKGKTLIKGAGELRVKETDRINSMLVGLKKMGADIECKEDDILIKGPTALKAAKVDSFGDHRTAMSFAIAGLVASGKTIIKDTACIDTSFPRFYATLKRVVS